MMIHITIDGLAASGKSTVGARLAEQRDCLFLDTGLLYRALTWIALTRDLPLQDGTVLATLARHTTFQLRRTTTGASMLLVQERDLSLVLRDPSVTSRVSRVAAHPQVRAALTASARALVRHQSAVLAGRDAGVHIVPAADLKLFLTASSEVRARRRFQQEPQDNASSLASILQDLLTRDGLDQAQAIPAPDAIYLDTSTRTIEEVLQVVERLLRERRLLS